MEYHFGKEKTNSMNLVLLVGSNPMPNYLLVEIFKPTKVTLISTSGTDTYKENLKKVINNKKWLSNKEFNIEVDDSIEIEAKNPKSIADDHRLKKLFSHDNVHLNYTGGTKAMSSQVLHLFYEAKSDLVEKVNEKKEAQNKAKIDASYLDDTSGILYFDSGKKEQIDNMNLNISLKDIWDIHGFKYKNETGYWGKNLNNENTNSECEEDINNILNENNLVFIGLRKKRTLNYKQMNLSWLDKFVEKMISNDKLRDCIYFILNNSWKNNKYIKTIFEFMGFSTYQIIRFDVLDSKGFLSCKKIDAEINSLPLTEKITDTIGYLDSELERYKTENISSKDFNEFWKNFLTGEWFEVWVERLIIRNIVSKRKDFTEIHRSVHCYNKSGDRPEIDLCMVVGRKLFMFSLTTDSNLHICKNKLFEIAIRAKQIGGDHVRTAFVSLIDDETKGKMEEYLDTSLKEAGVFSVCPEIYGLTDVKNWFNGKVDNLLNFFKGEI